MKNQLLIIFVFIFSFTSCEVENDALDTKQMTSQIGELTQKLYDTLTGIQWGKLEDKYGWTTPVE